MGLGLRFSYWMIYNMVWDYGLWGGVCFCSKRNYVYIIHCAHSYCIKVYIEWKQEINGDYYIGNRLRNILHIGWFAVSELS